MALIYAGNINFLFYIKWFKQKGKSTWRAILCNDTVGTRHNQICKGEVIMTGFLGNTGQSS